MSADWNTKYGPRRVLHDPPTLDEAIFAAVGITDDQEAQAEIAAALMGMPFDTVRAEVKKLSRTTARSSTTRVIAGEKGTGQLLILSQIVLSLQLPFAVVPLVMFTASRAKMGEYVAPRWLTALAALVAATIIALNAKLVFDLVIG